MALVAEAPLSLKSPPPLGRAEVRHRIDGRPEEAGQLTGPEVTLQPVQDEMDAGGDAHPAATGLLLGQPERRSPAITGVKVT